MADFLFTSESVTEGHPDKICDQVSDAILDEVLRQDPTGRVACEAFVSVGMVVVGGQITTTAHVDVANTVRRVLKDIGYTDIRYGIQHETCAVLNAIGPQSPDIAQGVDTGGAGDQGLMIGYACRETEELMPLPIMLAHKVCRRLAELRKSGQLAYLGPDGKSQVCVQYDNGRPVRIDSLVISCQHTEDVLDESGREMRKSVRQEIIQKVGLPALDPAMVDSGTRFFVNPTGKFVIGGPQSDTGMTGRKIMVDAYGGAARHGGGAFSGKDPTKVDRSAAYMARYVAKNCVVAGVCDRMELMLAYVIGVAEPVAVSLTTCGTNKIPEDKIYSLILDNFDFRPRAMIERLDLLRPIYLKTAAYGHFGRTEPDFTWEKTDSAALLRGKAGL